MIIFILAFIFAIGFIIAMFGVFLVLLVSIGWGAIVAAVKGVEAIRDPEPAPPIETGGRYDSWGVR